MNTDFIRQRAYSFLLQLLYFKTKKEKNQWKDAEAEVCRRERKKNSCTAVP